MFEDSGVKVGLEIRLMSIAVPAANAREAAICADRPVYGASTLTEVFELIRGNVDIRPTESDAKEMPPVQDTTLDFSEIRGQVDALRAVEVALAGVHNILMIGPPGAERQ